MVWFTSGYVDNAIGTSTRVALAPTTAAFIQFEEMARSKVKSEIAVAGYFPGDDSENATLKRMALGWWYVYAGGLRKGLEMPQALGDAVNDVIRVHSGELKIAGLTQDEQGGIAGSKFSSVSSSSGRPRYWSRDQLKGF